MGFGLHAGATSNILSTSRRLAAGRRFHPEVASKVGRAARGFLQERELRQNMETLGDAVDPVAEG
jgi:hypothetical protein